MTALPRFDLSKKLSCNNGRLKENDTCVEDDSKLGFATISDKMHRKAVKKGFNFTVMVVGECGLGKSTLVNSMLMQDVYETRTLKPLSDRICATTSIETHHIELDEKGIKLRLTIVDTPGFSDAVNADKCWDPIEEYIDSTFDQYLKDECGIDRKHISDHRVHCCLYFVSPWGHGLRPIDVTVMKRLHSKVNLVPIIAKADSLINSELVSLKQMIRDDLEYHQIHVYQPPECDSDEDEEFKRQDGEIKSCMPFAVIGGNVLRDVNGKKVRVREYPWGSVEIENSEHCDFKHLRLFLLRTHMQDLKDMTKDVHYENYRALYITDRMCKRQTDRSHVTGNDVDQNSAGVVDTVALVKQKEEELQKMQALLEQMQGQLKTSSMRTTSQ